MSRDEPRATGVARRYARALLSVAAEKGAEDAWAQELDALAAVFTQEPLLRRTLTDPLVQESRREEILETLIEAAGPSDAVAETLRQMLAQDRMDHVAGVAAAYGALLDEKRGVVEVAVTTAEALDDAGRARLTAALENLTGRQVRLDETVDPDLLGGVVARVGDTVYDASVLGRLQQVRQAMAAAE